MDQYLPYLFVLNIVLALADVSIGYHLAPLIGGRNAEEEEEEGDAERSTLRMRKLLGAVVAFYTFFNCLAYSKGSPVFLFAVTGVLLVDMLGQLLLMRKLRGRLHY